MHLYDIFGPVFINEMGWPQASYIGSVKAANEYEALKEGKKIWPHADSARLAYGDKE